jgi:hypothetical protein
VVEAMRRELPPNAEVSRTKEIWRKIRIKRLRKRYL